MPRTGHDIFIVGAGRAGVALATALLRSGHKILGTWNRTAAASARVRAQLAAPAFHGRIPQVARSASVLLLTVTDDALPAMARQLVKDGVAGPGMVVAHVAGALDSTALRVVKLAGAAIGSMHPVASFPEDSSLQVGTYFAVEGEKEAVSVLRGLVEDLGGTPFTLEPGHKPRYHAALVFASNYLVSVASIAMDLLRESGLSEREALNMAGALVEGTARNLRREGLAKALTGPITRGDINTVRAHLKALESQEMVARLYRILGQRALKVAVQQGLDAEMVEALEEALRTGNRNA